MKTIKVLLDKVESVIKAVCCILVCGFTALTLISVIARYILHAPIWWSEQFCRYLFIWMLMLYAPLIVRKGKNLGFDLIVTKFPFMVQEILQLVCEILIGIFGGFYCVYTIQLCIKFSNKLMEGIRIPAPIMYGSQAVCGALICIFSIEVIINHIISLKSDKKKGGR